MAPKSTLSMMTLALNLLTLASASGAADLPGFVASGTNAFRTERLSPRQTRLWNSIRKIVQETDHHGRVMHPVLYGLWQAVEQSGHRVFVELITDPDRCSNMAGETVVEEFDPKRQTHSIRIRLFISTIARAYAGEQPSVDGISFVPFSGLRREERYAKVLGHELSHIDKMLRDPEYMRLVRDINEEQLAIATPVGADGTALSNEARNERLSRIWPRILESEKPALAAEAEIYRELLAGK